MLGRNIVWLWVLISAGLTGGPESTQNPAPSTQQQPALKAQPDNVYVNITADYGAQLMLIDPQGRKTGYDVSTAQTVSGIPGAVYSNDSISDATDASSEPAESESRVLEIHSAAIGRYSLKVSPTDRSTYNIGFSCTGIDGPSAHISASDLGIAPGEEHSFIVMIAPMCSETFVFGAFGGRSSGLLTYGYPMANHVSLASHSFRLVIVYDTRMTPSTFAATIDGNSVANLFHPKPGSIEAVTMPVKPGHHIVQINVSGVSADGKQISAEDSFAVDVAAHGTKIRGVARKFNKPKRGASVMPGLRSVGGESYKRKIELE